MTARARRVASKGSFVGVISDTHGLLRPEAIAILQGCHHIIHAGDIGSEHILGELAKIAPVTAVRGNNDTQPWARTLPDTARMSVHGRVVHILHDLKTLDFDPAAHGVSVVVAGHSHKPAVVEKDDVLYLNPGSAGPRRFNLPLSAAKLYIARTYVRAEIVGIDLKGRT